MAFRRITYHRSWFMIVVGTIGLASIVANLIANDDINGELVYLAVFGCLVTSLMIVRGFTGEWGKKQLRIDVAGGKLKLPDGSVRSLDELGALTIEAKLMPKSHNPRMLTRLTEYRLRAANVEYYLFYSFYESETKLRFDAVDAAVVEYRVRRILERPTADGSAFRSGPDPVTDVLEVSGDAMRAQSALHALTRDGDPHVRAQAAKLAGEIAARRQ
jgi:hypothetical protein